MHYTYQQISILGAQKKKKLKTQKGGKGLISFKKVKERQVTNNIIYSSEYSLKTIITQIQDYQSSHSSTSQHKNGSYLSMLRNKTRGYHAKSVRK